jgi:hypothetical protein
MVMYNTGFTDADLAEWKSMYANAPPPVKQIVLSNAVRRFGNTFAQSMLTPDVGEIPEVAPTEKPNLLGTTTPKPHVPWYAKPVVEASEHIPGAKQGLGALSWYQQNVVEPTAMTVAGAVQKFIPGEQGIEKSLRENNATLPWQIPTAQRHEAWEETKLPWGVHTGMELAFDPTSYIGWGIPGAISKAAGKAGMSTVAEVAGKFATAEGMYNKVAGYPFELVGKAGKKIPGVTLEYSKGKLLHIPAPFQESIKSRMANEGLRTYDLMSNLTKAGMILEKTPSQILDDIRVLGRLDPMLEKTITNPEQKLLLQRLIKYKDKTPLAMFAATADRLPEITFRALGNYMTGHMGVELGVYAVKPLRGVIGFGNTMYNGWKHTVLFTPFYVVQQMVENPLRLMLTSHNPVSEWGEFAVTGKITEAMKLRLEDMPMEMRMRALSFMDRWKQRIPEYAPKGVLNKELSSGGLTDATLGSLSIGKREPHLLIASEADNIAILTHFDKTRQDLMEELLLKHSPETARYITKLKEIFDDPALAGVLDPHIIEHLRTVAITGTPEEMRAAFNRVLQNPYLGATRAMTDMEKALPEIVKLNLQRELTSKLAAGDLEGVRLAFEKARVSLPKRVEDYQKQRMLATLETYQRVLKAKLPKSSQKLMGAILRSTKSKMGRVSAAEAELLQSKTLTEAENAMFLASREYRREMDMLTENLMLSHALNNNVSNDTLQAWYDLIDDINTKTIDAGDAFSLRTIKLSRSIHGSKTPSKAVVDEWNTYIMDIQSEFPDIGASMAKSTPNTDLLWSTHRSVKERMWSKASQEKLTGMGIPLDEFPRIVQEVPGTPLGGVDKGLAEKVLSPDELAAYNAEYIRIAQQQGSGKALDDLGIIHGNVLTKPGEERKISTIIDTIAAQVQVPGDGPLDQVIRAWVQMPDNQTLQLLGKGASSSPEYLEATRSLLKDYYPDGYIRIFRGGKASTSKALDREFTNVTSSKATAKDFVASWPNNPNGTPLLPDINDILIRVEDVVSIASARESELIIPSELLKARMASPISRATATTQRLVTLEDFVQEQRSALFDWQKRVESTYADMTSGKTVTTARDTALMGMQEQAIQLKQTMALTDLTLRNHANDAAARATYEVFGNVGGKTNFDEIMSKVCPFWFFPSRSIPFYAKQMIQKPRLGYEILTMHERSRDTKPDRLFGTFKIPGTNYYYNPLQASMLWQLWGAKDYTPANLPPLEAGMRFMNQNLGISMGPQIGIATALATRALGKQGMVENYVPEPQDIIPQNKWLNAVEGLRLPVISQVAGLASEPFDTFTRAVYGTDIAQWQKREVEKYMVDEGVDPVKATTQQIQSAWKRFYTRQLASIPGGAVKEMTTTEAARYEYINKTQKEMGLTSAQIRAFKQTGESAFTGLRQDQLDAIYKGIPAEKLWRNIRPVGLTQKTEPYWNQYLQLKSEKEDLRGTAENPSPSSRIGVQKMLDSALLAGKIDASTWRDLRRENYQHYSDRIEQLNADYPLAPKTDEDWESFRKLLGWEQSVRHPDDIKLQEYYDTLDNSLFENGLGQFDAQLYNAEKDKFMEPLAESTRTYIQNQANKYKTPLEVAFAKDSETLQPYWAVEDTILSNLDPSIAAQIQALGQYDSSIQQIIIGSNPYLSIILRRIRMARQRMEMYNPEISRALLLWYGG